MTQQSIHDRIMSRSLASPNVATAEEQTPPNKGLTGTALGVLVVALALGAAGIAASQFPTVVSVFAQNTSAAPEQPAVELPKTPFLEHVNQAGIETCGTVFPVLGQLLAEGANFDVRSQWHNEAPNKHSVQALVGMDYADPVYSGPAAGFVFASPNGTACEGAMVRIAPLSRNCDEVPTAFPAGSTLLSTLGKVPVYNLANNGGQVLLLPSDQSCIVVSVAQVAG